MSTPLLEPFGPEIWLSAGPEVEVVGFRYPTRMVVIRLGGDGVLVISPSTQTSPTLRPRTGRETLNR